MLKIENKKSRYVTNNILISGRKFARMKNIAVNLQMYFVLKKLPN
jgi:hypothetical protein